ncbi:GNAT family acetyltransferase [Bosea sp. Root381]|uniref:GNAT family N-acetyltransferase n=1 Tax=Bosea sp. Root381 TaxID=1736524 RepID=UPI0006F320C6|nr:GNAT family N-acetyltransferase [Bosea sp. Root381]KRE18119.1 GNAT family acetyltransferase [Bosea sp. Root381]
MSRTIRPATAADLDAIRQIVREAYTHYIARIGREPGPMLDDYGALITERRVSVIEHDGVVQGLLVLIPQPDAMLLDNIAVSPRAQGLGLGRALLEFAEHAAQETGYRSIKLYTHEMMTENIALYSRIGYAETHRIEEKGLRRIYMLKPLGSDDNA